MHYVARGLLVHRGSREESHAQRMHACVHKGARETAAQLTSSMNSPSIRLARGVLHCRLLSQEQQRTNERIHVSWNAEGRPVVCLQRKNEGATFAKMPRTWYLSCDYHFILTLTPPPPEHICIEAKSTSALQHMFVYATCMRPAT